MRARVRFSRSSCCSRKISAVAWTAAISLVLPDKRRNAHGKVWLGRKTSADSQRIAYLLFAIDDALDRSERHVVDLGVRAPLRAARDGDLELPRQVVELGIRRQLVRDLDSQRRSVDDLVSVKPCQRAARNIANHIAAGALRTQPHRRQRIHYLRKRFNRQPVQLNILTRGDVCKISRILLRQSTDDPQLLAGENAVRQPDAHHEVLSCLPSPPTPPVAPTPSPCV